MKKYECVLQDGPKDCGICALLTIIKTHGGLVSKEYLRSLTNTTSNGVNAFQLLEAGKKIGFYTQGVNGDVFSIEEKYLPCIAHVIIDKKYKHFVVIHKIDKKNNTIVIADPSRGILRLDIDKFKSISTNNYLFFIPNKNIPRMEENNLIKNKIGEFVYNNKATLLTILVFSILYTIINILLSFNFQFVIDRAINLFSKDNLLTIVLILLFIYFLKNTIEFFREKLISFIGNKISYILICDSLSHILSLPLLYFKNRTTGEVLSRISDLDELKEALCDFIVTIFVDLLIVVFSFFVLFSISSNLATMIFFLFFLYSFFTLVYNRLLYSDVRDIKEKNAVVNSSLIETINGALTIKELNILEKIKIEFSNIYNNYLMSSYKLSIKMSKKKLLDNIVYSIVTLLILKYGGELVIDNKLTLASLISFNAIIFYNLSSLRSLLNFDLILKKTKIIIERVNELLNIKEEKLYFDLNPINNINGSIKIECLSFKYNDNYIINNFSATFHLGKKILITGNSGCGKSTLAKIISGFIEVKRNKVFIGNVDINDINLWNLREQVTYVSQNEYLFNNTLYENINIKKARDKSKVLEISKCMLVDEIVSKNSSGFNMLLEENAINLSGGERQRVILARTFLKNSNIFILDETFSEINIEKERIILENIFSKFIDKTIIVISHRFDNSDLFDEVYNMEKYGNSRVSKEF